MDKYCSFKEFLSLVLSFICRTTQSQFISILWRRINCNQVWFKIIRVSCEFYKEKKEIKTISGKIFTVSLYSSRVYLEAEYVTHRKKEVGRLFPSIQIWEIPRVHSVSILPTANLSIAGDQMAYISKIEQPLVYHENLPNHNWSDLFSDCLQVYDGALFPVKENRVFFLHGQHLTILKRDSLVYWPLTVQAQKSTVYKGT